VSRQIAYAKGGSNEQTLRSPLVFLSTRAAVETKNNSKAKPFAVSPRVLAYRNVVYKASHSRHHSKRGLVGPLRWIKLFFAGHRCDQRCVASPSLHILAEGELGVYYYFYERSKATLLASKKGAKALSTLESMITGAIAGMLCSFLVIGSRSHTYDRFIDVYHR
jgi:adenine nucleotide transporter 17